MSKADRLYPLFAQWAQQHGSDDAWARFATVGEELATVMYQQWHREQRFTEDYGDVIKALKELTRT